MTVHAPLADLEAYVATETASAYAAAAMREAERGPAPKLDHLHREAVRTTLAHRLARMRLGIHEEPPHPRLMNDISDQITAAGLWPYQQKRKNNQE